MGVVKREAELEDEAGEALAGEVDAQVLDGAGGGVVEAAAKLLGVEIADPEQKGEPVEAPVPAPLQGLNKPLI